jgi:hypothetical protein
LGASHKIRPAADPIVWVIKKAGETEASETPAAGKVTETVRVTKASGTESIAIAVVIIRLHEVLTKLFVCCVSFIQGRTRINHCRN